MQFLQITTTQPIEAAVASDKTVSLIDLALKGGWFMIPLVIMSIVAIYIVFERYFTIQKATKGSGEFMDRIKSLVIGGDIKGAKLLCSTTNSPEARMIDKALSRLGGPMKNIEDAIENVGKLEVYRLEKNLSVLGTISGAGPMVGFLGTVTGMISAFIAIAQEEGTISPKLLSSGIYEAMITTVAGLIVGIIAYIGYNYLSTKVGHVVHKMEAAAIDFMDLLQEPGK